MRAINIAGIFHLPVLLLRASKAQNTGGADGPRARLLSPNFPAELFQYSGVTTENFPGFILQIVFRPLSLSLSFSLRRTFARHASVPCFAFPFELQWRRQCQLLTFPRRRRRLSLFFLFFRSPRSLHLLLRSETEVASEILPRARERTKPALFHFSCASGRPSERKLCTVLD